MAEYHRNRWPTIRRNIYATANDWIGAGKATYTITREGIPSTLLKFESFKLTVDGKEFTGNESDKTITYGGDDCNGHTTWGQKDIVATVTYTNLATGAPETASKTITRHITGLPYIKNSETELSGTGSKSFTIDINTPSSTSVKLSLKNVSVHSTSLITVETLDATIGNGSQVNICNGPEKWNGGTNTFSIKELTGDINGNSSIKLIRGCRVAGPYVKIGSVSVYYN